MGKYTDGIGYILRGVSEVLITPHDFTAGVNDVLKGLGMLGLHQTIIKSMKAQGLDPQASINTTAKVEDKK